MRFVWSLVSFSSRWLYIGGSLSVPWHELMGLRGINSLLQLFELVPFSVVHGVTCISFTCLSILSTQLQRKQNNVGYTCNPLTAYIVLGTYNYHEPHAIVGTMKGVGVAIYLTEFSTAWLMPSHKHSSTMP